MTEPLPYGEAAIIAYIEGLAKECAAPQVRVGIGDDTAVLTPEDGDFEMLVTTDQVIENTHFIRDLHPPDALGAKTLVRGVSDIAAMGGLPRWFTLSLGLPREVDFHWVQQFIVGMFSETPTKAVPAFPLVGGDVARAPFIAAHVTVTGAVEQGRAMRRSAARPGDAVYVSGRLGGSALGLERLLAGTGLDDEAVQRHLRPQARVALGRELLALGVAACMDLSDGLSTDAARMARASGVALVIETERLPVFPEAGVERALSSGEEYELLFTAPRGVAVPETFDGLSVTRIGRVEAGAGVWRESGGGERRPLEERGFEHFAPSD
ncbi:MAG: thiamine-phosphate kinase [Bryobacterales bacterium]|nr:thiamine-phosphate kinase [Bryobacterales bacterium]